jgi:hypothetical protein
VAFSPSQFPIQLRATTGDSHPCFLCKRNDRKGVKRLPIENIVFSKKFVKQKEIIEPVPKSVILKPAFAVFQAKALQNCIFIGCSSKI